MIRILFVFGDVFKKGGTETVMLNIFDHSNRTRFSIDFLLLTDDPDESDAAAHIRENGGQIYQVIRRGKDHKEHLRQLNAFFREHTYDIVHSHADAIGDEALLATKNAGVKIRVAHSHNTRQVTRAAGLKGLLHKGYLLLEKHRLRKVATHYVACSEAAGEWLFGKKICSGKNYLLFRNAIDLDRYIFSEEKRNRIREDLGITPDQTVIGYVGAFRYQKNHEFLLKVFAKLSLTENAILLLAGSGELQKQMEEKATDLGISGQVRFLGDRKDVPDLLQAMDLFVMPSHFEGLPVAGLEAQAAGLKCLVSNRVSPELKISSLVTFLPIDQGEEIWVQKIRELLAKKQDRVSPLEEIRQAGYDAATNIRTLERFYEIQLNHNTKMV